MTANFDWPLGTTAQPGQAHERMLRAATVLRTQSNRILNADSPLSFATLAMPTWAVQNWQFDHESPGVQLAWFVARFLPNSSSSGVCATCLCGDRGEACEMESASVSFTASSVHQAVAASLRRSMHDVPSPIDAAASLRTLFRPFSPRQAPGA